MNNASLGRSRWPLYGCDEGRVGDPVSAEHAVDVAGRATDDDAKGGLGDSSFPHGPVEGLTAVPADLGTGRS